MLKPACLVLLVSLFLCAPNALRSQTAVPLTVEDVAKIKAQEFARALAQLKVQEVALQRATPIDERSLETNHAQQNALEQELTRLSASSLQTVVQNLEAQQQIYAADLRPRHPKMLAIQARIDQAKAALAANH